MARDAIARQYDVDKNAVKLEAEPGKDRYQTGTITFQAKKGKSIDLRKMAESIRATRLSGGTNMSMNYLEITATGEVEVTDKVAVLKVGAGQQFLLGEDPEALKGGKLTPFQRLRAEAVAGAKIVSVTGRVQGWKGPFPVVLRQLAEKPADAVPLLIVTDFELGKK